MPTHGVTLAESRRLPHVLNWTFFFLVATQADAEPPGQPSQWVWAMAPESDETAAAVESPPPPAEKPAEVGEAASRRVLVLDLKSSDGDKVLAATLSLLVAEAVTREPNISVTSGQDLQTLIARSAAKQEIGCDETMEACIAQLADALDADIVVSGTVARLEDEILVSLTAYDSRAQAAIARATARGQTAKDLPRRIDSAVARLFGRVVDAEETRPLAALVPIGAVIGAVGAVGAITFGSWTVVNNATLLDPQSSGRDKTGARDMYTPVSALTFTAVAVGAAGLAVAGIGMWAE
jgi:hypothetical protein